MIVVPAVMLISPVIKNFEDRKILFFCIALLFGGLLLNIDYNFDTAPGKHDHMRFWQYISGSAGVIIGTIMVESVTMAIIAKVSAPTSSLGALTAGMASGYGYTIAQTLGNVITGVCALISGEEYIALYMYTFFSAVLIVMVIITALLYSRMQKLVFVQRIIDDEVKRPKREDHKTIPAYFEPFEANYLMTVNPDDSSRKNSPQL